MLCIHVYHQFNLSNLFLLYIYIPGVGISAAHMAMETLERSREYSKPLMISKFTLKIKQHIDFYEMVDKSEDIWLVLFYTQLSSDIIEMQKKWQSISTRLEGLICLAIFDITYVNQNEVLLLYNVNKSKVDELTDIRLFPGGARPESLQRVIDPVEMKLFFEFLQIHPSQSHTATTSNSNNSGDNDNSSDNVTDSFSNNDNSTNDTNSDTNSEDEDDDEEDNNDGTNQYKFTNRPPYTSANINVFEFTNESFQSPKYHLPLYKYGIQYKGSRESPTNITDFALDLLMNPYLRFQHGCLVTVTAKARRYFKESLRHLR